MCSRAAKMERGKRLGKFKWMVRWLSAPIFTRGVGYDNMGCQVLKGGIPN